MAGDNRGPSGIVAAADGAGARPHKQKILQQCQHHGEQYAAALFKQVMDKLDDALFERGNKGGAGAEDFIDAARQLRVQRQELSGTFFDRFADGFKSRLKHAAFAAGRAAKDVQGGGLSLALVDERDLEESLAIDGLVAKVNDRCRNELFALAQRFNHLVDGAQYKDESLPLSPDVFAHAFRDTLQAVDWKVEVKLVVFKLFEQIVLRGLGDFYHDTNALLAKVGILPQLKPAAAIRVAASSPASAAAGLSPATGGAAGPGNRPAADGFEDDAMAWSPAGVLAGTPQAAAPGAGAAAAADIYQTLQRLMSIRKYGDAQEGGLMPPTAADENASGASPASLPADDLVRGLSLLQHEVVPAPESGAAVTGVIKGALLDQMRQLGDARGLHPAHDNTIDVIGMIFEFILDEPSISDVVKDLLNRLQIPILKVAIVDKGFFTNKAHPARRLLNVLGHASIGWNDREEESRRRRFEKMEYVVARVLSDFEQDPGIFAELLEDFTAFLTREGAGISADAVPASEEQVEEGEAPDRLAFETIESCLEGAEVPEVLRAFLRGTWRDVLQHALDREGSDGAPWRRRCQALGDLMWSVEPKRTADERRKMVMLLPRLLDELRDAMKQIERSTEEIDAALDALEPIHMACLRGEPPAPVGTTAAAPATREPRSSDEVADMIRSIQQDMSGSDETLLTEEPPEDAAGDHDAVPAGDEAEDDFTAMAADMTLGTWLEFDLDDKKRRAKLAWKSAVMGEYVFVDRKYKVIAERTLASLAADLRHGRVTVVADVAMFDRALDKVLNGLMSGGKTEH